MTLDERAELLGHYAAHVNKVHGTDCAVNDVLIDYVAGGWTMVEREVSFACNSLDCLQCIFDTERGCYNETATGDTILANWYNEAATLLPRREETL